MMAMAMDEVQAICRGVESVELAGEVRFATGLRANGTEVGGLSAMAYNPSEGTYYVLSDDRAEARFYTATVDLADGWLDAGDVRFQGVTYLATEDGQPFARDRIDPEGIDLEASGTLWIASEGNANWGIAPFARLFSPSGRQLRDLPVPDKFLPRGDRGVRQNLAFESLTLTPDDRLLYTATENALRQDGDIADLEQVSISRILEYDRATGQPGREFAYIIDPVPEPPQPADGFRTNGLVELRALDNCGTFLTLERSFSEGRGNTVKLYEVSLEGARDISDDPSLADGSLSPEAAVQKRLVADVSELGVTPDNLEGMALGSQLPDGRQSLILVSDNNFNKSQVTQFIALALDFKSISTRSSLPNPIAPGKLGSIAKSSELSVTQLTETVPPICHFSKSEIGIFGGVEIAIACALVFAIDRLAI
jgi:3-phytase/alkaline phosphatase D